MTIEVFIKKPEKVEVLQYDGTNYDEVVKFAGEEFQRIKGCFVNGDYIIKSDKYKIVASSSKPDFAKQDLIGTYSKDVVQGVNPNVHMSLEKLQEYFEVPIVDDRKKDVDKIASNNNCGVKKYQKKPIVVEAVKNEGNNIAEIMQFTKCQCSAKVYGPDGFEYLVPTPKGTMTANIGDYIAKGVEDEFYLFKPDEFEATYDEYNEQQDGNHASKPSSFSLRDLVMQFTPKHIKYYIKRLEEYGFKLKYINEAEIKEESAYIPFTVLEDEKSNQIWISNRKMGRGKEFQLIMPSYKDGQTERHKYFRFEVKNNNWHEAFNKLVASFPDEILKNTNHHAGLTS